MTQTKYQLVSFSITAVHCEDATDVYEDENHLPSPHGDGDQEEGDSEGDDGDDENHLP